MQACNLSATDIACRRGDRVLFRDVCVRVETGDALYIKGANGIGKSSLMRILAGLLAPFAGDVSRIGSVGLVDERPALDTQLPLGKALSFWSDLDGSRGSDEHSERLEITDLLDVPVRYLSTGQKKRAAMARLLKQNADIWLLDEPLNGLDTDGVTLVETLIAEYCAAGGIAVVASHQPITLPAPAMLELSEFAA